MTGDIYPNNDIKLFQTTASSLSSETAVEKKIIEAIVKKDLSKLDYTDVPPDTSTETITDNYSKGYNIQINSKELELDRTYAVYSKHVTATPLVNQSNTSDTSSLGLIGNADLIKTINVSDESASFYNSTAKFIFTDGPNQVVSETGNLQVTLDKSNSDEYNAFKSVNHRRSRLNVSGENVDGLRVKESTEFNGAAAYLTEKQVSRDTTNGQLSVSDYQDQMSPTKTLQASINYPVFYTNDANSLLLSDAGGFYTNVAVCFTLPGAGSAIYINNNLQIAGPTGRIKVYRNDIPEFPNKYSLTIPTINILSYHIDLVFSIFKMNGVTTIELKQTNGQDILNVSDYNQTMQFGLNGVGITYNYATSSIDTKTIPLGKEVTFNNDGYTLEIPTNINAWTHVIEGSVKVVQDDPIIDVVLTSEPNGDVSTLAISKESNADLATELTRSQFDQFFTPDELLNVGNRYKVEVSSHVGGGYSNDGFRGFSVDDSNIARNLKYMSYCQVEGQNFTSAPHSVEISNGSLSIVAVNPENSESISNIDLMTLSTGDESLNSTQYNTDGSVKIQLTSHDPAELNTNLTRWEYIGTDGSESLKGLEVTYHRIPEWKNEGLEEIKSDLAVKYKENAYVEFEPKVLVTNTRNSLGGQYGETINGTYERLDTTASNKPSGSNINSEVHIDAAHIGKSNNMAAVIPDNGNSVLTGTDIHFVSDNDVFSDYDDKLMLMQLRHYRNLVDESELYSENSGSIVSVRTDIVASNIDLDKLYDVNGTLFNARDMRLRLTTKKPEDLGAQFLNCLPGECSLIVTNYKVTDPADPTYEPNLLTMKEKIGATIMGSNANLILAKGDNYDLKVRVKLFTTDQSKADYVRNNVTMEYMLVDKDSNVVDNLTGLYDLIEEEMVDDVAPVVVTSKETEVTSGIVWASSAYASQYMLKTKTVTSTRKVLIPFKFGAYSNMWIKTPFIDMVDTMYVVYDQNTKKAKPDSYLNYVKFVDENGVQSDVTFTRRFTSAGFPGVVNASEINETIVFKPSALAGYKGVLEVNTSSTPSGPWAKASVSGQHVDIAHDVPSNLTVYSMNNSTQKISFNGDVAVDYVMGKYVDGDYLLEMSTPSASSSVDSFSIVTRIYSLDKALDEPNWDGVYANDFPKDGTYTELQSRISVSYIDNDNNQNTQPTVNVDLYVKLNNVDTFVGKIYSFETFLADVNIVRSLGTIVKSVERLGTTSEDISATNIYYWNNAIAPADLVTNLVSLGSNNNETTSSSGVSLWLNSTAQRGDVRKFRLRGDRVKVILYNGVPTYSGPLSEDDTELTYESGLVASDEVSRSLTFTYYRGYWQGLVTEPTYDEFVLDRTVTTIQMKLITAPHTFLQSLGDLYVGSNHVVDNLVEVDGEIIGDINLKFDGSRSMFSIDTDMSVPILLTFATFDLKVSNPLDTSYDINIVGESADSFRGKTYENNNSILPARIIVYNEEYYSIGYTVPDLKLFHSTTYVGDVRTFNNWIAYPISENLSDDVLRKSDTYLKESPTLLVKSVVRLQRNRINVQPHTKYFTAPALQMVLEAVGRDQVNNITYDASQVVRRVVYGDCQTCNTNEAHIRFSDNINSADFVSKQLNDITLVQYKDFKSPVSTRLSPDSTWRYFNIRSNYVRIELYTGLHPYETGFVQSSDMNGTYREAIYDGFIDELDLEGNQTVYLNVPFDTTTSKFTIITSQSLAPFIPNRDLQLLIEDDLPYGTLNLIWDGIMPHMRGTLYLNNYAGDSIAWGVIGNQLIRNDSGNLVYRLVKYEADFGANLDDYLTSSANKNLMLYAENRYTLDVVVPLQTLSAEPYNMVDVVKDLDLTSLQVDWVKDTEFKAVQLKFGFNPLSIRGRDELRTFFSVQVNKRYQCMLISEPDVLTIRKYDGTELARITGQGFFMSHGLVVTPWNFLSFHNA